MAQRKFPQGIQADPAVLVREHFNTPRAEKSEEFPQFIVAQEKRRQPNTQRGKDHSGDDIPPSEQRKCDD